MRERIPEIDVIIAVALWLHSQHYSLEAISIPKGQGIDSEESMQRLKKRFSGRDVPFNSIDFSPRGPDIEARCGDRRWRIECKGLTAGRNQTVRNNFDRGLSSAVSYYDSFTGLRIGLGLPREDTYLKLMASKIPQALREVLDLWIFLYDPNTNAIEAVQPTQQIPHSSKYIDVEEI